MQIQPLDQLIPQLEPSFTSKAPFQIPTGGREFIVKIAPWVVIVVAVLSIFGLLGSLAILTAGTVMLGSYIAYVPQSALYIPMLWISFILAIANVVLLLLAFPGLKNFQESGWRYMFYAQGLAVVSALASFIGSFSFSSLIMSALGLLIGLYILFQVRDYYTGKAKLSTAPASAAPAEPKAK